MNKYNLDSFYEVLFDWIDSFKVNNILSQFCVKKRKKSLLCMEYVM
jgi:hypothetical protein